MTKSNLKIGQVYVNTGFEAAYRAKFYHSIVRIHNISDDVVTVRSLSDNAYGVFSYGNWPNQVFKLSYEKDFATGRFRKFEPKDLETLKTHRTIQTLLYKNE